MPPVWLLLALNLGCLFAVGMGCHGELARQRPPTARLTEFYFFLSVGGVLGGVFNALVAQLIFSGLWEYPLVLLAACLMKPATPEDARRGLGTFCCHSRCLAWCCWPEACLPQAVKAAISRC
jgi:hypothetical protein